MRALLFSSRYLFSKKSKNAINVVTLITALGFAICTAAMIIILSALNGFVMLVVALFSTFDADIRITPKEGKILHGKEAALNAVRNLEGIAFYNEVLEENVLLKYNDKQTIATIKAVSDGFREATHLDTMLQQGRMVLQDTNAYCTLGSGIAGKLDLNLNDEFAPLDVFVPKREQFDPLNPENSFNSKPIYPTGMFAIQQEIDDKYILVPIKFARDLLNYTDEASSIEILVNKGVDPDKLIQKIKQVIGDNYEIRNRAEQHASLYKLMKIEKWVAFLILAFVLLIVSFNLVGALLMIVIEKKKDFSILHALGMPMKKIRNIILGEGFLIAALGCTVGLSIGVGLCLIQQFYGVIRLGGAGATFVVDAYPIQVLIPDIVITFVVALCIGIGASIYPSRTAQKIERVKAE